MKTKSISAVCIIHNYFSPNYKQHHQVKSNFQYLFKNLVKILRKFHKSLLESAINCRNITIATASCGRGMADGANSDDAADRSGSCTPEPEWRGSSMDVIYRNLNAFEMDHLPSVRPSEQHTVLYFHPIKKAENEPPTPLRAQLKWDDVHVRLPCSNKSQYPVNATDGTCSIESRWQMIQKALSQPIKDSQQLQAAILSYNCKYADQWNFKALHQLFEKDLDASEARVFFEDLLPRIIKLALRLPELIQAPIPLLKQGMNHAVTLTQQQISCLLANAFLCTFPRRNTMKRKSEYSTFPHINFNRLFQSTGQSVLEKIKCICHYFRRVCPTERDSANVPNGVVTFMRRHLRANELPNWSQIQAPLGLTPLHITSSGTIEDQGLGLLQVDFANKYLGGGVLGAGCVQEEIRFVICPELFVSKLFTECLLPTEALIMAGCERYSNYTGYADTFRWAGNHEDFVPWDSSRRRMTNIVAIDALLFHESEHQFREDLMLRELNKAYIGFTPSVSTVPPGVASGNWGCGAFGGEARLKALLQLMACAATKRPLVYFTFGDQKLRDEVHQIHNYFRENDVCLNELWAILCKFKKQQLPAQELYQFICNYHQQKQKEQHSPIKQLKMKVQQFLKKPNTTAEENTTAATKVSEIHSNAAANGIANESQDLFASSSDSDDMPLRSPKATIDTTAASANITDETDALLLAAAASLDKRVQQNNEKLTVSKDVSPQTPNRKIRQRTLLEMLDQCYTQSTVSTASAAPDAKRQCTNK